MTDLLATATRRAEEAGHPYRGAFTPQEALQFLQRHPQALLVDVRTQAERDWVGHVLLPAEQHTAVQWMLYPGGQPNPHFLEELRARVSDPDRPLLFLCRSGVRSKHAATLATEHGYRQCFDILEGFEGDKDAHGHRKTVNGWCFHHLPWQGA